MDHDKRIDKSITFVPVNIAILTVSDSRKADDDRSGDLLVGRVQEDGHNLAGRAIVTDDFDAITMPANVAFKMPIWSICTTSIETV